MHHLALSKTRRPQNGTFHCNSLDLFCFLWELWLDGFLHVASPTDSAFPQAEGYDMTQPSLREALEDYIASGKGSLEEILEGPRLRDHPAMMQIHTFCIRRWAVNAVIAIWMDLVGISSSIRGKKYPPVFGKIELMRYLNTWLGKSASWRMGQFLRWPCCRGLEVYLVNMSCRPGEGGPELVEQVEHESSRKPIWHESSCQSPLSHGSVSMQTSCRGVPRHRPGCRLFARGALRWLPEGICGWHVDPRSMMWFSRDSDILQPIGCLLSLFSQEWWTIQTCLIVIPIPPVFSSSKCEWSGLMQWLALSENAILAKNMMIKNWNLGCPLLKNHGWLSFLKQKPQMPGLQQGRWLVRGYSGRSHGVYWSSLCRRGGKSSI